LSLESAARKQMAAHTPEDRQSNHGARSQVLPRTLADLHGTVGNAAVTSMIRQVLKASPGRPMDPGMRSAMTSQLGHRLDDVEIHTEGPAAESATLLDARAFTLGTHVIFAPGAYDPETLGGQQLLVHELAHVVQQRRGGQPAEADPAAANEGDARAAASAVATGHSAVVAGASSVGVARAVPAELPALTPQEMFDRLVLGMRGFRFTPGGAPQWDPEMVGNPIGPGYATHAATQVLNPAGNQVTSSVGVYGGVHAEIAAMNNLGQISVQGGRLVVVVDQMPCPECDAALRQFASERGLSLEVWVPVRARMNNPSLQASPKTSARSAAQANRPAVEMEQVMDVPAPAAPGSGAAAGVAAEAAPAAEPAAGAVAADEAGTSIAAKPLMSPKVGTALNVGVVGLGVAAAVVHPYAVQSIKEKKGYAPVGPLAYAHEGFLSRVGRFLTGMTMEMQEDLRTRFNLPVWRANVKKSADAVPTGGTLLIIFQVPLQQEFFQDIQDVPELYRKKADGGWELMPEGTKVPEFDSETVLKGVLRPVVHGNKAIIKAPDLNLIVGPASDEDVGAMLNVLPDRPRQMFDPIRDLA
jgi:hypothetical protein